MKKTFMEELEQLHVDSTRMTLLLKDANAAILNEGTNNGCMENVMELTAIWNDVAKAGITMHYLKMHIENYITKHKNK